MKFKQREISFETKPLSMFRRLTCIHQTISGEMNLLKYSDGFVAVDFLFFKEDSWSTTSFPSWQSNRHIFSCIDLSLPKCITSFIYECFFLQIPSSILDNCCKYWKCYIHRLLKPTAHLEALASTKYLLLRIDFLLTWHDRFQTSRHQKQLTVLLSSWYGRGFHLLKKLNK